MHPGEGEIRAYHDHELSAGRRSQVESHLAACPECQERAAALLARAQRIHSRLAALDAGQPQPRPVSAARARLAARLAHNQQKEINPMWKKLPSRLSRPTWVGLAIIALLAFSLAFAPVRAIANSFLGLFRVQQIQVVQINPGNLPNQLNDSTEFQAMFNDSVQFQANGEAQEVASREEAAALAGIPVRLPAEINRPQTRMGVQPGGQASVQIDLPRVRLLLQEIGRGDIELPDELDGATISVDVPAGVVTQYGDCEFDPETARGMGYDPDDPNVNGLPFCTTLMQVASPTIEAPEGLNVTQLGEAYLQLMGMSREEAIRFAQNVDWTSTFVIPIPRDGTQYTEVMVDGANATLIETKQRGRYSQYLLIWVKDGVVYALAGPGNARAAVNIANSLK